MSALITGVGALSPLGMDLESLWSAVLEEKDCIRNGLGAFSEDQWDFIRENSAEGFGGVAQISFVAASEAMKKAGWASLNSDDGLILGTTTGHMQWEKLLIDAYQRNDFTKFLAEGGFTTPGRALAELCQLLNFSGKSMMISSACSASTQALGLAAEWVKSGRVKRCLVGGAEILTQLSTEGFRCLGLLAKDRARPFDEKRAGINLSEAGAFFCVESTGQRRAVAVIKGCAMNSDAYHLTAPHPEGLGTVDVLTNVLRNSALDARDIDWIHAHGTASASNDKAEGIALHKVLPNVPVTSTKAYHGHSLGASGALESAICVQALRRQMKVKSLGCENLDPTLELNIQKSHETAELNYILKNSLGFGGINAALILAHPRTLGGEK